MVSILRIATFQISRRLSLILILFSVSFPVSLALQPPIEPGLHIVGGVDSSEPVFARVSIMHKWKTGWFLWAKHYWASRFCGGVIVKKNAILTASHCLHLEDVGGFTGIVQPKEITVYTGGSYTKSMKDARHTAVKSYVKSIHMLEPARKKVLAEGFDIAVLILKKPLSFDSHRQPVEPCNSSLKFNKTIHTAIVVGAGLEADTKYPDQLQELEVDINDTVVCLGKFFWNPNEYPPESVVCLNGKGSSIGNRKNICPGDSGGPLLLKTQRKPRKNICVYGISSFSEAERTCETRKWSAFATKVGFHQHWIESILSTSPN